MTTLLPCPVCQAQSFDTRVETLDLPYFGEASHIVYLCRSCGFRRVDVHITSESDPVRYRLEVTQPGHLNARVVRSASCHFEVPELGVRAEPGEAADAFVSNVEGVLERCENAIRSALGGAETDEDRERVQALLDKAEGLRQLAEPWTVVLEDPLGNSAIVGDDAERSVLTQEEADALGHPYLVVDVDDDASLEP